LEENKEEVEYMCTPDEFFEARYKFKYRKEGRAEGLVEGKVQGIETRTIEFIRRIMQSKDFNYEQAARYLELTKEEQQQYQTYFVL